MIVSQIEKHLETNAGDIKGWQALAPIYQRMNRLDDAEGAFRKWLALAGDDKTSKGQAQLGLGQVLATRNGGAVRGEAFEVFEQASQNVPNDATAFFFLAVGLTQQNKTQEGIAAWTNLIDRFGNNNPPWLATAQNALANLKAQGQNPTTDQVDAAKQLSATERNELIEGMVSRLADRLKDEPDDLIGWNRLIQAYGVLGRKEQANDALSRALAQFSGDETAINSLKETAKAQGL